MINRFVARPARYRTGTLVGVQEDFETVPLLPEHISLSASDFVPYPAERVADVADGTPENV